MSCRPPSDKQVSYAEALVDVLEENQHRSVERFRRKLARVSCIKDMSDLIDRMIQARQEVWDADRMVDRFHRKGG